ncbi:histone-lysine N-methyltransferase Set8-like [Planococcus citri]|uniref:histone-lysine N-methyltransferase Set8-like n=1 Tax=Planococcus citri TaxID=170843 RepID=UPI0031F7DB6F
MVRGKKKSASNPKSDIESVSVTSNVANPAHTKSKRKFKGKLSHSNTVSPNKITKYYNVSVSPKSYENSPVLSTKLENVYVVPSDPINLSDERNVLRDTNTISINDPDNLSTFSDIDKTESCVPFSPSTALSQLDLNVNKKVSRIRKRLLIGNTAGTNVLNSIDGHIGKNILKNITGNKLKADHNGCNPGKSQTKLTEFYPVRRSVRKTGKAVLEEQRKTLEDAVLSNKEDGLEVQIFEGKGRGVVAARKFQKGEFVVEYAGELITFEEAKKREGIYSQDENTGCYMYYFKHKNNQFCVDATKESGRFGRLLNHSRSGNLCTKTIEVGGIPRLILTAREDIKPGCELTYDYGDRSKLSLQYHPWLAQ